MPIDIRNGCKLRLIDQLASELADAQVYCDFLLHGSSLRSLSEIRSLPDKGGLAEELRIYIGESPFETFVTGEVQRHFKGPGFNENAEWRPLTSFEGYEDVRPMATAIVESFCTLPWTYQVIFRLPGVFEKLLETCEGEFRLSDRHRIVSGAKLRGTHLFPNYDQPSLQYSLLAGAPAAHGWEDTAGYLQVDIIGYAGNGLTEPMLSVRDDVLSFFGLGIALKLFVNFPSFDLGARPKVTQPCAYRLIDGAWQQPQPMPLDQQHIDGILSLSATISSTDAPAALAEKLHRIGSVFRSPFGRKIQLSARWLFDSYCGRDQLLAYVQAAVSIEILLGDDEHDASVGLTTLMANRCAYLIANTPAGRSNLIGAFREIYKIRSKIVHTGKNRLNRKEVGLFHYLQALIHLVISEEQSRLE